MRHPPELSYRRMDGLTEWILCQMIGVKEGCVLSPILFALFIAELEMRIKRSGVGAKLGGKVLGGLLFADDLVLMAESVNDIQRLTTLTDKFMRERKLEINVAKSACMRVGRGRAEGLSVKFSSFQVFIISRTLDTCTKCVLWVCEYTIKLN